MLNRILIIGDNMEENGRRFDVIYDLLKADIITRRVQSNIERPESFQYEFRGAREIFQATTEAKNKRNVQFTVRDDPGERLELDMFDTTDGDYIDMGIGAWAHVFNMDDRTDVMLGAYQRRGKYVCYNKEFLEKVEEEMDKYDANVNIRVRKKAVILTTEDVKELDRRVSLFEMFSGRNATLMEQRSFINRSINKKIGGTNMQRGRRESNCSTKYITKGGLEHSKNCRAVHGFDPAYAVQFGGIHFGHTHPAHHGMMLNPMETARAAAERTLKNLDAHEERINKLELKEMKVPTSVYVNEEKRTVVLVFVVGGVNHAFVSKASESDKFNPELGFLVAYYHKMLGVSKGKISEDARKILGSRVTFLKGFLYSEFMRETGFTLTRAEKYIQRKIK